MEKLILQAFGWTGKYHHERHHSHKSGSPSANWQCQETDCYTSVGTYTKDNGNHHTVKPFLCETSWQQTLWAILSSSSVPGAKELHLLKDLCASRIRLQDQDIQDRILSQRRPRIATTMTMMKIPPSHILQHPTVTPPRALGGTHPESLSSAFTTAEESQWWPKPWEDLPMSSLRYRKSSR